MAVSNQLPFLTILLCLFLARAAVAASNCGEKIHAVKRCSPGSDKGDHCTEEKDDADDDFDDTYKIVNNVAFSLSPSGRILQQIQTVTTNETATATTNETMMATTNETATGTGTENATTTLTVNAKAMSKEKEMAKEAEKETEKDDFDPEDNPAAEEATGNMLVLGH